MLIENCKVRQKQKKKQIGARYSVFLELPYYDSVRFVAIDIMHNLFLGTAKHVMSIWKEMNILSTKDFEVIQARVQDLNVPQDIGRIPYKRFWNG